jgi:hypothetical protein
MEAIESFENSRIVPILERPRASAMGIPSIMHPKRSINKAAVVMILPPL